MNPLKLSLILILAFTITGCGTGGTEWEDTDYEDVKELIEETEDEKYKVRGSCNSIPSKSHCVDYIGSFWTEEQMKLNCSGPDVTYSNSTCPYSNNGGCQATGGTITETIIWSYQHGGQPISAEDARYEAMACNVNPASKWVTPDEVFIKK